MSVIDIQTNLEPIIELWGQNKAFLEKSSVASVNRIRSLAFDEFLTLGLPNKKVEEYKYTDLSKLLQGKVKYAFDHQDIDFKVDEIFKCDIPELDAHVVILLNGFYYDIFNSRLKLPDGVYIDSFNRASNEHCEIFEYHYGRYATYKLNHLVSLNTAFVQDGVFIYLPANTILDKPIQIINLLLSETDLMVQPRNLVVTGANCQADIIVCDHTLAEKTYITNSVTEVFAGENTIINYQRIQNENNLSVQLSNLFIHQEQNSQVKTNTITLHGGVVRNNVNVELNGEGCDNYTNGIYMTDHEQHVDNFVYIRHSKPHCTSNQLFKGVLNDKSTGAFTGRIYVARDAQKTAAYQRNNNVLLSDSAKMSTKPQLEIYADDVKCSHGATVGQIDENALFYMQARGIAKEDARLLMMFAFIHEVIDQLSIEPLKTRVSELVEKRLKGELSRCNTCPINCSH